MDVELPTDYDVIVVGTGLVECIVAAASARIGKKVLHIDKNDYYGGQWTSFTLQGMEQWVSDIATSSNSETTDTDETLKLEEGETVLATCDPVRAYSNVKQQWYINKTNEDEAVQEEEAPKASESLEKMEDTAETNEGEATEDKIEEKECVDKPVDENEEKEEIEMHVDDQPKDEIEEKKEIERPVDVKPVTSASESNNQKSWSQENMMKLSRKFNLDLAPNLLYSRGSLVELLISSNVARYSEFKCITRVLTWLSSSKEEEEGELVVVPCSRSDVFTTDSVSLIEKRLLMKLLEFCHSYDQHPEQLEEFTHKTFLEFLQTRRQTPNLIHFVSESIAMVNGNVSCQEGLEKTKLFLTSLGRYGTTPFLFSMYGCGELPQAFCRLCAVFEGTYVLRRPISNVIMGSDNLCVGLMSEKERFKCSHLVMDAFYAPSQYVSTVNGGLNESISRGIFILDKSIMQSYKEQFSLLRLPPKGNNTKPVIVLEMGFSAGVCPRDLYCVHMTCQGSNAEDDLKVAVSRLFASEEEASEKPRVLWSLYYNQVDLSGVDLSKEVPENIHLCSGPDINLDYDSAISQARSVFTRMFPEEEFLPRAPDPDEIVFDNAGAEPKQGDNFSSEETAGEKKEETEIKDRREESQEDSNKSIETSETATDIDQESELENTLNKDATNEKL